MSLHDPSSFSPKPARLRRLSLGSALVVAVLVGTAVSITACAPRPLNLVVISLDTLRADHLGFYGYPRPTSPALDALAQSSIVFERAMTQALTTGPSHLTLMTGLYPHSHGVFRNGDKAPEQLRTLGDALGERGYDTAGFVSGLPLIDELIGLGRSFQTYDDEIDEVRREGEETVDLAQEWLRDRGRRPYFLFVHLYDAHGPYLPSEELAAEFRSGERGPWAQWIPRYQRQLNPKTGGIITDTRFYVDRYDAQIRHLDDLVARLLSEINLGETVLLVVSDHGETLNERLEAPFDHGARLLEEQIRIVGLLRAPGLEPRRIRGQVGMVDFAPTLLGLLGVEDALSGHQGRDLTAGLRDGSAGKRAEFSVCTASASIARRMGYKMDETKLGTAVRVGDTKLVSYPGATGDEILLLYDLATDPGETSPRLADAEEPEVKSLLELMERWNSRRLDPFKSHQAPDEFLRKLESLGYVL